MEKSFQADMRRGIISMFLLPKAAELDALTGGAFTRLSRRHDAGAGLADP